MADKVSKETRSKIMSKIKSENTSLELNFWKLFWKDGWRVLRFREHDLKNSPEKYINAIKWELKVI